MLQRPLPIRGLPLAPAINGLTVMEDVVHATSSHPRRPIAPLPSTRPAAPLIAADPETNPAGRSPRWHPEAHYRQPPQHRPRPRHQALPDATTATVAAIAPPSSSIAPAQAPAPAPAPTPARAITATASAAPGAAATSPAAVAAMAAKIAAAAIATTQAPLGTTAAPGIGHTLFPSRRHRKTLPNFVPNRPEAFVSHHHPLAVRSLIDLLRFFPFPIGASAGLVALSGYFAASIVNRATGSDLPPTYFIAGYLALYLLNLLTHYSAAKGQLFFSNRRRFLRLLAINALLLLPHFIAYSILTGMAK